MQIESQEDYEKLSDNSKARVTYNFLMELYGKDMNAFSDYWNGDSDDKPNNYDHMKWLSKEVFRKLKTYK